MNVIIIICTVFVAFGIIELVANFNLSLLITIICTLVVAYFYIKTDKECKKNEQKNKDVSKLRDETQIELSDCDNVHLKQQNGSDDI